jgi:2,4-dienoyl-CoA reductase (NADPH2)
VTGISNGSVALVHALTGDSLELPADFVAVHGGTISNDGLAALPWESGAIVRTIGDCVSPRRLTHANWDADRTVLELMRADSRPERRPRAW